MDDDDNISALFDEAVSGFEALLEETRADHPPEKPLACRAGCDHCCRSLPEITVTAIETFHITDYITGNSEPAEIEALINTLIKTRAEAETEAPSWPLAPCPLLKDGRCSIYEARPLICRGYNSYSVSDCEKVKRDKDAYKKVL